MKKTPLILLFIAFAVQATAQEITLEKLKKELDAHPQQDTFRGLSLAYDIVTKGHGGDLKVHTVEGEGSEFIIHI